MANTLGCDLSHFNPNPDFHKIVTVCGFTYFKATQGDSFVDPTFASYRIRASSVGLRVGAYHFIDPLIDGGTQAKHLIATLGTLKNHELAPAIDSESTPGWDKSKIQVIEDFASALLDKYGEGKSYFSPGWWEETFAGVDWSKYPSISALDAWVAEYGVSTPRVVAPYTTWQMHQYSEKGTIPGAGSNSIDTDRWNGQLPA